MDKDLLRDLVYVGLQEMLQNKKYYYQSSIDSKFSHLTEEGKTAIIDLVHIVAPHILAAQEKDFDDRAKKMVMDGLKS